MESELEKGLRKWQAQQERFETGNLFSPEVLKSRLLLKEKLTYLEHLQVRYPAQSFEDQVAHRSIQVEIRKIERQLYPTLLSRLLAAMQKRLRVRNVQKQVDQFKATSNEGIRSTLTALGFSAYADEIQQKMKQDKEFSFPVSFYVSQNDRMDYELSFKKDLNDNFILNSYKATLTQLGTEEKRSHTFNVSDRVGFNHQQAYDLLCGRALRTKHAGGAWFSLDLADKDAEGNYRSKVFPDIYHVFKLKDELKMLPFKSGEEVDLAQLAASLENGFLVRVPLHSNGQTKEYSLHADPQHGQIRVFDSSSREVSITELRNEAMQMKPETRQQQTVKTKLSKRRNKRMRQGVGR